MKRENMPRGALLPELFRKMEYDEGHAELEKITVEEFLALCTDVELKHFRAVINGKLSKRDITPEQQAKMQEGRKKNKPN